MMDRRRALMGVMAQGTPTEITGDWGRVYIEKVTAGTNTVANMEDACNYIAGLRTDKTGIVTMAWRVNAESPSPANNECGGIQPKFLTKNTVIRWASNKWNYSIQANTSYSGVITEGSVFIVVSSKQNKI